MPAAGSRPDFLAGVRPQERVQQHPVDQIVDTAPALPILDVPVPLMGGTAGGRHPFLRYAVSCCRAGYRRAQDLSGGACVASRSWWNSWWKCQLFCTFSIRKLTFQFLVLEGDMQIFKVFSVDRVQQRLSFLSNAFLSGLWSRTLVFLEEVFKDSRPVQGSTASSSSAVSRAPTDWLNSEDKAFQGFFFALFFYPIKVRRSPGTRVRECLGAPSRLLR